MGFAFVVAGIAVLESLPVTYPRAALVLAYAPYLATILAAAALAHVLLRWGRRRRGEPTLPSKDELLFFARTLPLLMLTLSTHFLLKSFVWLVNPRTWDRELLAWDQSFHLGVSPSLFLTTLIDHPAFLRGIDVFYSGVYYALVIVSLAVLLTVSTLPRRLAFATAFAMLWIVGAVLYLSLPSWGPVFVVPGDFEATLQHMPGTVSVQSVLFEEVSSLVRDPLAPRVVRFGSVAAFPSLHLAVVTLFALASRGVSRAWFRANVVVVGIMVVGSVVTGYHYLIDTWAGMLIAAACWWTARRLFPDDEPAEAAAAARAA